MASARERQVEEFCSRIPCAGCGNPTSPLGSHDCDAWRRQELDLKRIHEFALPPEDDTREFRQVFEVDVDDGHLRRINAPSRPDGVRVTDVPSTSFTYWTNTTNT